jgi:hypothetical protein
VAITDDPQASVRRALGWVALSALIAYVVRSVLQLLLGSPFSYLTLPLGIYIIVLEAIAIKETHRSCWGSAIAVTLLVPIAIVLLLACVVVAILVILGPVIGNVFSNIFERLESTG